MRIVSFDLDRGNGDDMLSLFGPDREGPRDFFTRRHILDGDDPVDGADTEGDGDPLDHLEGGPDDEDAPVALRGDGFLDFRDLIRVCEDGGLDGAEDSLFSLCGSARNDFLAADEQAVVDDEVDVEAPRHMPGLEALPRSALSHEGESEGLPDEPREESAERVRGSVSSVVPGVQGKDTPGAKEIKRRSGPQAQGGGFAVDAKPAQVVALLPLPPPVQSVRVHPDEEAADAARAGAVRGHAREE